MIRVQPVITADVNTEEEGTIYEVETDPEDLRFDTREQAEQVAARVRDAVRQARAA